MGTSINPPTLNENNDPDQANDEPSNLEVKDITDNAGKQLDQQPAHD